MTCSLEKFVRGRDLSRLNRIWVPRQYTELEEHLLIGSIVERAKCFFITVDPEGCAFYFSVFDLADEHFSSVTSFGFGRDYESIARAATGMEDYIVLHRPTSSGGGEARLEYKFKNSDATAADLKPRADGRLYITKLSYGDDGKFVHSHVQSPNTCSRKALVMPSPEMLTSQ